MRLYDFNISYYYLDEYKSNMMKFFDRHFNFVDASY